MRCWESPGDLPLVIEIVVSFRSFRCAPLAKRHNISTTRGRSSVFPKNVCKNLLFSYSLMIAAYFAEYLQLTNLESLVGPERGS
jgi:hypothetical protein